MRVLLFVLLLGIFSHSQAATYYFSTSGNDSYTPAQAQNQSTPWKSIARFTALMTKASITTSAGSAVVSVAGGDKFLFKRGDTWTVATPIKFGISGLPSARIYIGAWGTGPKPVFSGWYEPTGWQTTSKANVYQAYVPGNNSMITSLYLDDEFQAIGRWPNAAGWPLHSSVADHFGTLENSTGTGTYMIDNDYTATANRPTDNWKGAEIVHRGYHFTIFHDVITSSTLTGASLRIDWGSDIASDIGYQSYYFQNHIATLDLKGEWAYVAGGDSIQVYLPTAPSNYKIRVPQNSTILDWGQSHSYYTVENLTITGSNDNTIYADNNSNFIDILNCTVTDAGRDGIYFKDNDHVISYDSILNCNSKGIESYNGNAVITNNYIHNIMMIPGQSKSNSQIGQGIQVKGSNYIIDTNRVINCGGTSINFDHGDNIYIRANYVDSGMMWIDDVGIIYTVNQEYMNDYRDKRVENNIVVNSLNLTASALLRRAWQNSTGLLQETLYGDLWTNHVRWEGNIVRDCRDALFINDAFYDTVKNNIFYNYSNMNSLGFGVKFNNTRRLGDTSKVAQGSYPAQGGHRGELVPNFAMYNNYLSGNLYFNAQNTTSPPGAISLIKLTPTAEYMAANPTATNTPTKYGTINNQYFVFPFDQTNDNYFKGSNLSSSSWSSWNGTLGYDATKTFFRRANPTGATQANISKLIFNDHKTDSTVFLDGKTWIDAKTGTEYLTNKVVLTPFTGKVLIWTNKTVTTSNTPPTVTLTAPNNNAVYTAPAAVTLTATASDADGNASLSKVEFYRGSTLIGTVNYGSSTTFTYNWTNVAAGTYALTARAYDNAGGVDTSSVSTIVVNSSNKKPLVAISSPLDGATYKAGDTINIIASASDADGSVTKVVYYKNGAPFHTEATAPYEWPYNTVPAGTYVFTAVAFDDAGDSTISQAVTVNVITPSAVLIEGEMKKWHKTTLTFDGPTASEGGTPNPALDYRLNVTFTSPTGEVFKVPGYFAADGNASETGASSGSKWRVHLAPNAVGTWSYSVSMRQGTNVAVSDVATDGTAVVGLDGKTGSFVISASDKSGIDLRAKGRLKYSGASLLQWSETGEYFRKSGTDAPENFLAYSDFDNTPDSGGLRKTWTPHLQDWQSGDPTWMGTKGKGIIGAVNYLSSAGLNSFSFLTFNVTGDDKNVYPYTAPTSYTRIDVSKLAQWEILFEHAQKKGMYLHYKLQETESDQLLDGGALGTNRKLYLREMIARFSHHLALNWNLGEENSQTTQQQIDMAAYIYSHDPYHSNIVVHSGTTNQEALYRPLLGTASALTGASLQLPSNNLTYSETKKWVDASAAAGKKWIVANDEQGPSSVGVAADAEYTGNRGTIADNSESIRQNVLWGNFMAGGAGVEYYFGYSTGETDLTLQDFRSRAKSFKYAKNALDFFHNYFANVETQTIANVSTGLCLGKPSQSYAVYLQTGGSTSITLPVGTYSVQWYDPRNGGALQNGTVTSLNSTGAALSTGLPPSATTSDWVALITVSSTPVGTDGTIYKTRGIKFYKKTN